MQEQKLIPLGLLCEQYRLELSFFEELGEIGLIEFTVYKGSKHLHQDALHQMEKILRIHRELHVNLEGVDVVMNILERQEQLRQELIRVQNRLRRFEEDL
ncbi:chaperone modulator CbpM [Muriicola sp.]|uniref:chaperone modulator CbpM n=1 Tax=Muriicola sp. TaxID=2020856 RepID=UPI003C754D9A